MTATNLRPLGECSDYVVEEHPHLLKKGPSMVLIQASAKAGRQARVLLQESQLTLPEQRLAHLDLHMLAAGLRRHGLVEPEDLLLALGAVNVINKLPNGLLYEDLIHANPLEEDPRTFLEGENAVHERLFYEIHRNIEGKAAEAAKKLQRREPVEEVVSILADLNEEHRRLLRELPAPAFTEARPYFNNPAGIPGPSGKYSAGIFALDALCMGSDPKVRTKLKAKLQDLDYFPTTSIADDGFAGQSDMLATFETPVEGVDLKPAMRKLGELRNIHFGIVAKFLPGVLLGTAGEEITSYLNGMRNAIRSALSFK